MSNCGALIPQEILTDILSRLPIKSLCRFKCVSPSWKTLISDPHFAKTHLNRTKTLNPTKYFDQKIIVISSCDNLYSIDLADANPAASKLDFPSEDNSCKRGLKSKIRVLSSYDGLLLVSRNVSSNYFLLNPSTGQCTMLPSPASVLDPDGYVRSCVSGIGYDSFIDDYKVVRLSSCYSKFTTDVVVYSLKTNSWRRVQDCGYDPVETSNGVFFNGCLHFLCRTRHGRARIVAFDLSDEVFAEVRLPASFSTYTITKSRLAVLGGCLCFVSQRGYESKNAKFWMMKEHGVRESWSEFRFHVPEMSRADVLCLLAEDEYLLRTKGSELDRFYGLKLDVYNSQKKTRRDMVVSCFPTKFTFGSTYVESIISPYPGGGIGRQ